VLEARFWILDSRMFSTEIFQPQKGSKDAKWKVFLPQEAQGAEEKAEKLRS